MKRINYKKIDLNARLVLHENLREHGFKAKDTRDLVKQNIKLFGREYVLDVIQSEDFIERTNNVDPVLPLSSMVTHPIIKTTIKNYFQMFLVWLVFMVIMYQALS